MSLGFFAIHPVTLPIGNELTNCIINALNYMSTLYGCIIKPELAELIETLQLCL